MNSLVKNHGWESLVFCWFPGVMPWRTWLTYWMARLDLTSANKWSMGELFCGLARNMAFTESVKHAPMSTSPLLIDAMPGWEWIRNFCNGEPETARRPRNPWKCWDDLMAAN